MTILTKMPNGKLALFSNSSDSFVGSGFGEHSVCMILFDLGCSFFDIRRKFLSIDKNDFYQLVRKELSCLHYELDVESSEFKKLEDERVSELIEKEDEDLVLSSFNIYRYPLYVGDGQYVFVNDVSSEIEFAGSLSDVVSKYLSIWSPYFNEQYLNALIKDFISIDKGKSNYFWVREHMSNAVEILGIK